MAISPRWNEKMANFLPTVARLPSTREILSDERDREREGGYRDQSIIFDPSVIPSIAFESLSLSFFIITSNQFSKFILFIPRFCFIYTSISVEEKGENRRKEDKVTEVGGGKDHRLFILRLRFRRAKVGGSREPFRIKRNTRGIEEEQ